MTRAFRPFEPFRPFAGLTQRGGGGGGATRAALVIGVGQSLMAGRGGVIAQFETSVAAIMASGGAHISAFDFWSFATSHTPNWVDWATSAPFAEGGDGQSPLAGIGNTLTGYETMLLHSTAVGATGLTTLHTYFHHVDAAVERGVSLLLGEGYERTQIDILFAIKHGEADATNGTSQADYEALFADYVARCRLSARRHLERAGYVAPFHVTFPVQMRGQDGARAINAALVSQADALSAVYIGEMWSVPILNDRTHPTADGYVMGGERIGRQLSLGYQALRCTGVTLTGATFVATFSKPVVRDDSLGLFTDLNATNARDGLEWWDGSAYVAITNLAYSGNTVTGTLASAPAGGELRIASQDTTGTLVAEGPNGDHVGCAIRSTEVGWPSIHDPTYTHYDWCIPQVVEAA